MRFIIISAFLFGCLDSDDTKSENTCEEYVNYMCDCHSEETNCSELHTQFEDATPDDLENCAVDLDSQIEEDTTNGLECPIEETDSL